MSRATHGGKGSDRRRVQVKKEREDLGWELIQVSAKIRDADKLGLDIETVYILEERRDTIKKRMKELKKEEDYVTDGLPKFESAKIGGINADGTVD